MMIWPEKGAVCKNVPADVLAVTRIWKPFLFTQSKGIAFCQKVPYRDTIGRLISVSEQVRILADEARVSCGMFLTDMILIWHTKSVEILMHLEKGVILNQN